MCPEEAFVPPRALRTQFGEEALNEVRCYAAACLGLGDPATTLHTCRDCGGMFRVTQASSALRLPEQRQLAFALMQDLRYG